MYRYSNISIDITAGFIQSKHPVTRSVLVDATNDKCANYRRKTKLHWQKSAELKHVYTYIMYACCTYAAIVNKNLKFLQQYKYQSRNSEVVCICQLNNLFQP